MLRGRTNIEKCKNPSLGAMLLHEAAKLLTRKARSTLAGYEHKLRCKTTVEEVDSRLLAVITGEVGDHRGLETSLTADDLVLAPVSPKRHHPSTVGPCTVHLWRRTRRRREGTGDLMYPGQSRWCTPCLLGRTQTCSPTRALRFDPCKAKVKT